MSVAQHQLPQPLPRTMLLDIVETICDRPGDTREQRDARSLEVIGAVRGMAPRDPVELMLARMAVLHAYLIQDSARDLVREQDDRLRSKMKSTITGLDRAMLGFLRELRIARKRPLGTESNVEPRGDEVAPIGAAEIIAAAETKQCPEPRPAVSSPPPMPAAEVEPPSRSASGPR